MAPKFVIARSEATWQSRSTESDHRKTIGEIVTAVPYQPPFRGTRHCRGGACPSRCCTNDSHRLSLKWQPPQTGPVAALSERPVGSNSTVGGRWCTSRSPDVSLRGAKRRGNLGKAVAVSPVAFPRCGRVLRDCHVGRWPPRNDKSGAITVLSSTCAGRQHCAGPGCPLPYNGGCGRQHCAGRGMPRPYDWLVIKRPSAAWLRTGLFS